MKPRVTLRQIAAKSGYHFSTVSLALKGHSSIPQSTRRKIKKVADAMGYTPDPVLSALASYRQQRRPPEYAGTIVWLSNYNSEYHWKKIPLFKEYYRGASEEARRLGYKIEEFSLTDEGMSPKAAARILSVRNVAGILIPPQEKPHERIELDWSDFSVVTFGYTLEHPRFHMVSNHHYRIMTNLLHELHDIGYRRSGFVLLRRSSERVENKWISAYLGETYERYGEILVPPLLLDDWDPRKFDKWFKKFKPDVLVNGVRQLPELPKHLKKLGLRVPEDVGLADHNLSDEGDEVAGMRQNAVLIGRAALGVLVGLIHRNEKGIPESPLTTLVEGFWYRGPTVRRED